MAIIVDLFAGPGGWSEGLRMLDPDLHAQEIGIEWDKAACATRSAAGHKTIQADISQFPMEQFAGKTVGLIASPPCQDFSVAGSKKGIEGERGQLITEVLRWTEALHPHWVVCEQVPPVLPIWHSYAEQMQQWGFSTWVGILNAADYGVPQTRKRAFLLASRVNPVDAPSPTHDRDPQPSLFGSELEPWVTMAEALGWGRPSPSWTICSGVHGAPDPFMSGGSGIRANLIGEIERGEWWRTRPATTIVGSFRPMIVAGPGVDLSRPRQEREGSVRITPQDALVLQSFPVDYPVQGSVTKQFEQIGNAVPPLLAAHVLSAVTGIQYDSETSE